ncbi:ankyrin repeat-containing domain protein [Xylariaceae sp. FL0255]|nr:ankyrin repeat-containing domain protein [Xylariaceae sp. FL0255]
MNPVLSAQERNAIFQAFRSGDGINLRKLLTEIEKRENISDIGVLNESKACNGNTVIHVAAEVGQVDMLIAYFSLCGLRSSEPRLLFEKNNAGDAPIHIAAKRRRADFVKQICKRGEDINRAGANNYTPLHYAVEMQDLHLVMFLMSAPTIDVNVVTESGDTPLHLAAYNDDLKIVRFLMRRGGAIVAIKNCMDQTPFNIAQYVETYTVYEYFIDCRMLGGSV